MIEFWENLVPSLESAKGSTYYVLLVLLLLSIASLLLQSRARGSKPDAGVNLALGVLMGFRLIELPVLVQAWFGNAGAQHLLTPLERVVLLSSFVVIGWLWQRQKGWRELVWGIELFVAVAATALLLFAWRGTDASVSFNYSTLDYVWNALSIAVLAIGFLLVLSSPAKQRLGLIHLGILLAGQVAHLLLAEPFGNMPLVAEAAQLISLPLLFLLPPVLETKKAVHINIQEQSAEPTPIPEPKAAEAEPSFFDFEDSQASGSETSATRLPQSADALAREIAETLHADLCLFVTMNEAQKQLELEYGFNVPRSEIVEPTRIPLQKVPRLTSALHRGRVLRLVAEPGIAELGVLSQALRLPFPGHLLAAPFPYAQDLRRWAVLLIHLERPWQIEDEVALEQITTDLGPQLASALGVSDESPAADALVAPVAEELSATRDELDKLAEENQRFRDDIDRLLAHIDELQAAGPNGTAVTQSSDVVNALQVENKKLKSALTSLEKTPAQRPASIEASQAKEELRLALEELAALAAKLEAAQQSILETNAQQPGAKINEDQVALIASIAQELRQPLSSIFGYTDLLLGESVGILGALQRKFLERVRNSTERMNKLIDDLIRIAELDRSGFSAQRKPVDLSAVFDDAIGQLREQLQEKRITLRVDLPRTMPELNTDRDALQQILYHLLQNADAATPAEGSITLRAVVEEQTELGEFVLIQVTDSGGGIPDEELPRVFSRVYRTTNPVIPGVGDTGVGLTIAETLTIALGGRIWVGSESDVGATFSVLLPLQPQAVSAIG